MLKKKFPTSTIKSKLKAKQDELATAQKSLADKQKNLPDHSRVTPGILFGGKAPYVTTGALGERGYQFTKIAGLAYGTIGEDQAKEEVQISKRLKSLYESQGFVPHSPRNSWLIPFSTHDVPTHTDEGARLVVEIRQKMAAGIAGADAGEAEYYARKAGWTPKTLSTINDQDGGFLRGFPSVGELIELQRNAEVFSQSGASQVTLPPNGLLNFPKQTSAGSAFFVGEERTVAESMPSTGNLSLRAKKLAILYQLTNDILRFSSPSIEAMARTDMARVAALRIDRSMLEGVGQAEILGLINYDQSGNDPLTIHTPYDVPANGNTGFLFLPEDVARMEAVLPDAISAPSSWVMNRRLWTEVVNRRADAVTAADGKGLFVFYPNREAAYSTPMNLAGTPVIRSRQVSTDRVRGSATNLTYAILGYFPDWIIGRMGVMEIVSNMYADSVFSSDQTMLRAIQYVDAGARHAASFNLFDQVRVA